MAQELTINNNEYTLKVTFKFLSKFGLIENDAEGNLEKVGNIVTGIVGGDVYTLVQAVSAMSGKSKSDVQSDFEALEDEDLAEVYSAVENLLEKSALTKKQVGMVIEPIRETFKNATENMMKAMKSQQDNA